MSSLSRSRLHPPPMHFPLDGGATLLVEPSHSVPLATIVLALRSGSAVDPAAKGGLARIAMRMLRRGCDGMSSEQIDFRIDSLGAEMAVDTAPSTVAIHTQVIARSLDAFVDLLVRLLTTSLFPDDELARLKRETVAEIIEARDNDSVLAQKALQRTLFEGHAYGRNSGGTAESVQTITREDVLSFRRRFLVQGNLVVAIAGDVTADRAQQIAQRLASALAPGEPTADDVAEPVSKAGRRLLIVDKPERTQSQILVGTLGTSSDDEDHVDLLVANAVFGGTFTSRLMKEVRSKRGWSYGASSRTLLDRRRQAWIMGASPSIGDAPACLRLILDLLDAWIEGGVSARETSFIKRYLVRSHAFDVDTAPKRLMQSLDIELLGLPQDYYAGWIDHVLAVTPESASSAVRRRIDSGKLVVSVVATATEVLEPLRSAVPNLAESAVVPFDVE